jgi:hypothetical protein
VSTSINKLTESERNELNHLCQVWNDLYGNAEFVDGKSHPFPFNRICELTHKQGFQIMIRVKDGLKIIGR